MASQQHGLVVSAAALHPIPRARTTRASQAALRRRRDIGAIRVLVGTRHVNLRPRLHSP